MHLAEDSRSANGGTEYGRNAVSGLMQEEKAERGAVQQLTNEQDHVLKSFRLLIADLCQQFNGGHPGYFAYHLHDSKSLT
jgi:dihydroxyacetone synthase